MNSRERLLTVMRGEIPDCVPANPDISNMVPVLLTGRPFWDVYIHLGPPLWKAYIYQSNITNWLISVAFSEMKFPGTP